MLTISDRDALKPLGIKIELFANSVCDTKYHNYVDAKKLDLLSHWSVQLFLSKNQSQ